MGTGETLKSNRQGQGQKGGERRWERLQDGWLDVRGQQEGRKLRPRGSQWEFRGQHTWDLKGLRAARGGATGAVAVRLHSVGGGQEWRIRSPISESWKGSNPENVWEGRSTGHLICC